MQVIVNGLMTNYERKGSGKAVVLLHGWGDDLTTFRQLSAMLAGAFDVIAVDLPGFGKTETPKNDWKLDDFALFTADFLRKIGIKETYAVIGHSNGGAVAIRGVASGKLSPDRLVLLASSGIRGEYKGRNKALRLITKTGKLLTAPLPKRAKKRLQRTVYSTVGSDMLVAENMQETFKLVVTDDVQNDAATIEVPTLLIYGSNDTATPQRYGERFATLIPKSKLEIIKGAGHFVHHQHADDVGQLVTEFLV
jgi:pimeloyl-ACP methyl ester carboxylesterase